MWSLNILISDIFSSFCTFFCPLADSYFYDLATLLDKSNNKTEASCHCVKYQVGSTLFKLGLVTMLQAEEVATDKSLSSIDKARTTYDKAEDMLRQAIRYYTGWLSYKV